jgi:hypothetical protein
MESTIEAGEKDVNKASLGTNINWHGSKHNCSVLPSRGSSCH